MTACCFCLYKVLFNENKSKVSKSRIWTHDQFSPAFYFILWIWVHQKLNGVFIIDFIIFYIILEREKKNNYQCWKYSGNRLLIYYDKFILYVHFPLIEYLALVSVDFGNWRQKILKTVLFALSLLCSSQCLIYLNIGQILSGM